MGLGIALAAIVGDCLTTWLVLAHGGVEQNPTMMVTFAIVGPYLGMLVGAAIKVAVLTPVYGYVRRAEWPLAVLVVVIVLVALSFPAIHNLTILRQTA